MDKILTWILDNPIVIIVIILVLYLILTYNNLNAKKRRVEKSFSTIDVYLEKRFDEISALLEQLLVGYQFEENTYSAISGLRSGVAMAKTGGINSKVEAINGLTSFIASSAIKTEAYPELKAIEQLGVLTMKETIEVEDNLAAARRQYNSNATSFNKKITSFPTLLVAGILGFKEQFELFKVSEGKKERPKMADINIQNNTQNN